MSVPPPPPFSLDRLPAGIEPPSGNDPKLLGSYHVVGRIGAGGMGAVYAGLADDGSCAAVKMVHPEFAADPEFRRRFAHEVDLVAKVDAACTPSFLGADVDAQTPWLATEYVPGQTLRQYVREHGPLTGGMLTALAIGLAEALVAIHSADVVHRDLKPGNVILAPDGPKVLDFGIARAADATALTRSGGILGTPGWISPEQYEGKTAGEHSDVFAWAGLVLFAATGRDPFGTGQLDVLVYRTRNEDPDLEGVPDPLAGPVRRAFAKEPSERPTAAQVLAELTGAWAATRVGPDPVEQPTEVVPGILAADWQGVAAPEPRRVRRGPGKRWFVAGAAALALVLLGGGTLLWPGASSERGSADGAADAAGGADEAADEEPLAVRGDPDDWEDVVAQGIELLEYTEGFEVYHDRVTSGAHGNLTIHRYTEDPQPVLEYEFLGGPFINQGFAIGEDPEEVLSRSYSAGVGVEPGPYEREQGALPDGWPDELPFVDTIADLLDPEKQADVSYQGLATVRYEGPRGWNLEEFDHEDTEAPAHHYSGTFLEIREAPEEAGEDETVEKDFDLWVDEDGYVRRFDYSGADATAPDEDFGGSDSWEIVFTIVDEPVEIEVPDESEIN
ncbi:serine/threonine-protein kinase [Nocardiopsis nanhaiensis]